MPSGRPSGFNQVQNTIIKTYIPAFEARVHELDPGLKGNNGQLSQWKAATAEEILAKPEFQGLDEVTKWRAVSIHSRTRRVILLT